MLNYFNFKKRKNDYLLTNDFGNYCILSNDEFNELITSKSVINEQKSAELEAKGFIYNCSKDEFILNFTQNIRNMKQYLLRPTSLHIFVVTTDCNGDCVYCQAKSHHSGCGKYMTEEIAKNAVNIAISSPCQSMSFEFQGGEPLMNFDIIRYIVDYSSSTSDKDISYNIVSNLTLLNDEMLEYIIAHNITLSTSLDGPADVHNNNRPFLHSNYGMYSVVDSRLNALREKNIHVGAIQTTTRFSLKKYRDIIDEYVIRDMDSIFIRPLTPLGMAADRWNEIGYTPEEFCSFYKNCIEYIISINKDGHFLSEGHARIFLRKILLQYAENNMDLRSPCGGGLGQLAYYSDGNIYTCDEARMLSEMGNNAFLVGNVFDSQYKGIISSPACRAVCKASISESLPTCNQCVYQPYCGVCPVVNYASTKDLYEKSPANYRCRIYRGMLDTLFDMLEDEETLKIFYSWIE